MRAGHLQKGTADVIRTSTATPDRSKAHATVTGLSDLDDLIGPLPRGKVTVLAGRASVGTSALVVTIVLNTALAGRRAVLVNLQDNDRGIRTSLLAAASGTNADRPESLTDGRLERLSHATEQLADLPLTIWTPEGQPVVEGVRAILSRTKADVLVVDSMALVSERDRYDESTMRAFAALAAEHDAAVVLTEHLRGVGSGHHLAPVLADFHEAELAAEADAVILVHRPNIEGTAPERGTEVDLIAVKGWPRTGTAVVRFEPEYHRMVDLPNA